MNLAVPSLSLVLLSSSTASAAGYCLDNQERWRQEEVKASELEAKLDDVLGRAYCAYELDNRTKQPTTRILQGVLTEAHQSRVHAWLIAERPVPAVLVQVPVEQLQAHLLALVTKECTMNQPTASYYAQLAHALNRVEDAKRLEACANPPPEKPPEKPPEPPPAPAQTQTKVLGPPLWTPGFTGQGTQYVQPDPGVQPDPDVVERPDRRALKAQEKALLGVAGVTTVSALALGITGGYYLWHTRRSGPVQQGLFQELIEHGIHDSSPLDQCDYVRDADYTGAIGLCDQYDDEHALGLVLTGVAAASAAIAIATFIGYGVIHKPRPKVGVGVGTGLVPGSGSVSLSWRF